MAIIGLPSSNNGGSGLTESQIKQIILTDIQTPGTLLHQEVVSVANLFNVLDLVYQDLQPTNQNSFLFETISTIAANTSEEVINSALDGNSDGIIHQAVVNTMLATDGSGVIYNVIETTAESIVNSFADRIGVGNSQYFSVVDAADAVITNQLLLGGTIDVAIKAGGA
jgi:homoaconitase/3-isopropylmalate dehydratase large subunit